MSRALAFAVAAVVFGFSTATSAVDVVNLDLDTHQMIGTDDCELTNFELARGEYILDF